MSTEETTREIARTPADVVALFGARMSAGDVDGALALYDPEATFTPEPGTVLSGMDAIRDALGGFTALQPTLAGTVTWTQEAGDLALVVNRWTLEGQGPDGEPVNMEGQAADVLRRGEDGGWRFLIDYPWLAAS